MAAERAICALAARQHGIVTRMQLKSAGVSRYVIEWRVKAGMLRAIHAGVYQVGPVASRRARECAAVLACPGAVVSHWTAAALWELLPAPLKQDEPVHVTVPPASRRGRRPGICAHRNALAPAEVTLIDHVPLTSPGRTLLDLSATASPRELERAVAQAERAGLTTRRQLARLLDRHSGWRGTRALSQLVERDAPPLLTRSEAEERLLALVRKAGLPGPELNVSPLGFEVDCYWRKARLVVEVDGHAFHTSRPAFLRDHQRDAALAAAGIHVLRLTWHQIETEKEKTLVQLAQALARAGQ